MIKTALSNWKTTSAGLTAIIGGTVHLVFAARSHSLTENDVTITLISIVGGIGLIAAGDAGAKPSQSPPISTDKPEPPNTP